MFGEVTRSLLAHREVILKSVLPYTQSIRHHAPIAGPPRFPMSEVQKILIGGGSLLIMMILPYWALFNIPRWSAAHRGVPYEPDEEKKQAKQAAQEEAAAEAEHAEEEKKK